MSDVINLDSRRTARSPLGRTAATERGEKVMDLVVNAACELLAKHWIHEVTVVDLARSADVARASLLLQFPDGMTDVLNAVLLRELAAFDDGFGAVERKKRSSCIDNVMRAFEPLFAKAERSGRLYANLRGAMFTWGATNSDIYSKCLNDYVDMTVELLTGYAPSRDPAIARAQGHVAEAVFNGALNVLAGESKPGTTWLERRDSFCALVTTAIAGLSQIANSSKRAKPRRATKKRSVR
jgi:AcrR family transcriptional regulator